MSALGSSIGAPVPTMSAGERERVIAFGRPEPRPYERNETIHALFGLQAAATPHAVAVVGAGAQLTYDELHLRSNRLARSLVSRGVRPGACVGIALDRTVDLPVGLLGILKAGAAYVPLDLSYPPERLRFMIEDAAIALVVSDTAARERIAACGAAVVALDGDGDAIGAHDSPAPAVTVSAESLAYVIYTSGSTGRPKGVAVPHRGTVRLVRNTNFLSVARDDVFLQHAPVAFDASTFEIWAPLLNGARLAIPRPGLLSMEDLAESVASFGVTTLFLTTMLFARLVEARLEQFGRLRRLLAGGEVLAPEFARRFMESYPACRFIHCYGPTENTTFSTTYEVPSIAAVGANVSIGRPIANSSAYVLDQYLEPVPVGVPGELCVGGDGVAREYLRLGDLTAERFVRDPFSDDANARLYRTGDRARWRSDGLIEFLGRTDNQVKIRGFRIELGEIEASLNGLDEVRDAVVVVAEATNGKTLVAYVVPANRSTAGVPQLRSRLAETLPAYMIPHRFELVDRLPETANGKVDRVLLARRAEEPAPPPAATSEPRAPAGPAPAAGAALHAAIADVWRDVLGSSGVADIDQNFFDAGGDSLSLLQLRARLKDRLQIAIGVVDLFEHTTIRKLAAFAERVTNR